MMNLLQLIGLHCRHPYLSRPLNRERICNACGARFPHSYTLTEADKQSVDRYQFRERSIKRVGRGLLPWRKRA